MTERVKNLTAQVSSPSEEYPLRGIPDVVDLVQKRQDQLLMYVVKYHFHYWIPTFALLIEEREWMKGQAKCTSLAELCVLLGEGKASNLFLALLRLFHPV